MAATVCRGTPPIMKTPFVIISAYPASPRWSIWVRTADHVWGVVVWPACRWRARLGADRREAHDAAQAASNHPGKDRLSAVEGAVDVDRQHPVPIRLGHLDQCHGAGHAGVVDQHVDRAEATFGLGYGGPDLLRAGDV